LGAFIDREYLPAPLPARFDELLKQAGRAVPSLDLSEGLPAARPKTGRAAALALYEVRSRIELPPPEAIPDRARIAQATGADAQRWTVPNTEIILVRVQSGPRSGEFLFSPETVARADEIYEHVRPLPNTRNVPKQDLDHTVARASLASGGHRCNPFPISTNCATLRSKRDSWEFLLLGFSLLHCHRMQLDSTRRIVGEVMPVPPVRSGNFLKQVAEAAASHDGALLPAAPHDQ
jgi:hypothetical protein